MAYGWYNDGSGRRERRRQVWEVGEKVNVGFLRDLDVVAADVAPERYTLVGQTGKRYEFTPHQGVVRLD